MSKTPEEMWRISNEQFSALIQFTGRGHVWWAAPAVKQMERWEMKKVIAYCSERGWKMERPAYLPDFPYNPIWKEVSTTESGTTSSEPGKSTGTS